MSAADGAEINYGFGNFIDKLINGPPLGPKNIDRRNSRDRRDRNPSRSDQLMQHVPRYITCGDLPIA